jgi:transglutaminase-like putative cysteine protease
LPRTLVASVPAAAVIVAAWLRLVSPVDRPFAIAAVALLGLAPALLRPRWLSALVALVLAARIAFGEWPRHLGRIASHFRRGFLDFYDVATPFDPRVHGDMRGVVLVAIFAFVLVVALGVAHRSLPVALGGLLVGAGWPATLAGNKGAVLPLGIAILVAALAVLAALTSRRIPRVALPAVAAIAVLAAAATASSAVAKSGVVKWQTWDFYNAPVKPVSVQFAWNADYSGITFPRKRTTVLQIESPPRSLFWRAAVLDDFSADKWIEAAPKRGDSLEPVTPKTTLLEQKVHVLALSDTRLVGASSPVSFDAGDAPVVRRAPGFAELPSGLTSGFTYKVQSYAPEPTAAQLERVKPDYPAELTEPGAFLEVWPGVNAPPFGQPRKTMLDDHQEIVRYTPILNAALAVAGSARTPYTATSAVLQWLRDTGGFRYTNRPALFSEAPLVGFVADTRAGYCQQFAGAMALMLRYLGIPARVAVGFSSGTYDNSRRRWVVTDHDAHAWVEVWFRGYGWLPFDPTPSAGRPEAGQLSAGYALATLTGAPTGDAAGANGQNDSSASAHHHGEEGTSQQPGFIAATPGGGWHHGGLVLLILLLLAAVAAAIVGTKLALRRVRYLTRDPRRLAGACRRELAEYLLDQQIEGARSATLHELGALVRHELSVDPDAFVAAATAARFGPPAGSASAARTARRELRALLKTIRRRLHTRERVRGLLSLRSLGFAA